jgi:hypothetical protein
MGNNSFFLISKGFAKIDWESMDTESLFLCSRLKLSYKVDMTIEDVGKGLDIYKLIGYMDYDKRSALCEFSKHLEFSGSFPCIFFTYEGDYYIYGLEFNPGSYKVSLLQSKMPYEENSTKDDIKKMVDTCNWYYQRL